MRKSKVILLAAPLLAIGVVGAWPRIALGQNAPDLVPVDEVAEEAADEGKNDGLEEITVTATRRAENVQDVPLSITALSGSFLKDVGLTEFGEVQKFTPNLQILSGADTRSTSVRIRGIGSVGSNAGIDPSVAIFIDGVYQGRAGMSVSDLLDIERVEVLRGPQGTLYGKNTAAGAINVYSRLPDEEDELDLELVVGNYGDIEARFAGNLSIVDGVLATRLAGYGVTHDGYDRNTFELATVDRVNDAEKWGLRSRTLWNATDRMSLTLSADWAQQDEVCCVADIIRYGDIANFPPGTVLLLPQAQQVADFQGITLPPVDPKDREISVNIKPTNRVRVGGVSLEGTYDWDALSLTSLTAYRHYDSKSLFDGDFAPVDAILWPTAVDHNQISQELRAVSAPDDLLEYVGGFYFYYQKLQTDDVLTQTPAYVLQAFGVNDFQRSFGSNAHETITAAGYGQATLGLSEYWKGRARLALTGGLRADWEQKDWHGVHVCDGPLCVLGIETPISGPDLDIASDRSAVNLSGTVQLRYWPLRDLAMPAWAPVDDPMFYASFANGFKSGGYNQLRSNTSGNPDDASAFEFGDERSWSVEGGMKSTWLDRLVTFNISGFYTDYDDFQAQVFDGLGIRVVNAGRLVSFGFESDLTVAPVAGLIATLAVGYNEAEYKEFPNAPCIGIEAAVLIGCTQDLAGAPLDNAPKWTVTFFAAYQRPFPLWSSDWFIRADYQYMSKVFLNVALDPALVQGPVNQLGFRTGWKAQDGLWDLTFWVKNATDQQWFVVGFDVPTMGGHAAFLAPPRTYGGTFRLHF